MAVNLQNTDTPHGSKKKLDVHKQTETLTRNGSRQASSVQSKSESYTLMHVCEWSVFTLHLLLLFGWNTLYNPSFLFLFFLLCILVSRWVKECLGKLFNCVFL